MTQSFGAGSYAAGSYSVPVSSGVASSHPGYGGQPLSSPEPTGKHAPDVVNHPPHYRCPNPRYNMQVIEVIEAWFLNRDHYLANAIKYILRSPYKGHPVQDIRKSVWYLQRWLEMESGESGKIPGQD